MPTYGKCAPFSGMSQNQRGVVGINRNNPCDGYFGCDDEEIFQDDEKALLNTSNKNGKQHSHLPWTRRKSPPVLSFFKRMASLRKHPKTSKEKDVCNSNRCGYRTLPTPKTKNLNVPGYACFPFDSGFTSLRRNYCCDGYFGCPPLTRCTRRDVNE